jgi:Alkylmercury lyase
MLMSGREATMTDDRLLARTAHAMLTHFVETGRAPHFTELALTLQVAPPQALEAQWAVLEPWGGWMLPQSDYVASFSPFSNIPTQYRISVDGEQRWYGQCGLESLAASWLFPGREVRIDARCLDCAEPITVRMRDGELLEVTPETAVGHANHPTPAWEEEGALAFM